MGVSEVGGQAAKVDRRARDLDGWAATEDEAGGRASQDGDRATLLLSCLHLSYLSKVTRHFLKYHALHTDALHK